uniref:Dolichol phosphate-mannose biosynthesis regulatory protein n=1 Tax=Chloropicon laureae TaxID=464258 RepID=A0A7S2Z206_9CHLO
MREGGTEEEGRTTSTMGAADGLLYRDRRRTRGYALMAGVGALYVYFTLWIVAVPLLEQDAAERLDALAFPVDRWFGIAVPTLAGVAMAALVAVTLGCVILREACARKEEAAKRRG